MKRITALLFALFCLSQLKSDQLIWTFPPDTISTMGQNASDPQVGIDSSGNVVALWVENNKVIWSQKQLGMNWDAPQQLSNSGASNPCLVVDASGNATAIWIEGGLVVASSKSFGGSWSSSAAISGMTASEPALALDVANGNVTAVWVLSGVVQAAIHPFGGSWPMAATTLSSTGADSPQVAMRGGAIVAVWHNFDGVGNAEAIFSSNYSMGSWTTEQRISKSGVNSVNPSVAIDPADLDAVALWFRYEREDINFFNVTVQSSAQSAEGWTTPIDLSDPGTRDPLNLMAQIAFDDNGTALAVWVTSFNDSSFNIQMAVGSQDSKWNDANDLVISDFYAQAFGLSVTASGTSLVPLMSFNTVNSQLGIYSNQISLITFTVSQLIVTQLSTSTPNGFPVIAARDGNETVYAAVLWLYNNGSNNVINAVIGTQVGLSSATNPMGEQLVNDFGFFNDTYNRITWDPSPSPGTQGYVIYRNGVYVTRVPNNVLFYEDHNRNPDVPDTYNVTAIDRAFTQSVPIIVTVTCP